MQLTADTNFWIFATIWDDSVCNKLLKKIIETATRIYISEKIIEEYTNVMKRDFHFECDILEKQVRVIIKNTKIVLPIERINAIHDDPSDNKILECAVASNSEYIITYDNHLLKLKTYGKIKIITPEQMLRII